MATHPQHITSYDLVRWPIRIRTSAADPARPPDGLHKMYPRLVARPGTTRRRASPQPPSSSPGAVNGPRWAPPRRPAPTCAGRWRPTSRSTTRSWTGSSSCWPKRRSRNGRPPWTTLFRCLRSAVQLGTRGDLHRGPTGDGRAAHLGRRSVRREFRASRHVRGGPPGHHSAARPAPEGQRRQRPAGSPGSPRRLRHEGGDLARQSRRAHRRPAVCGDAAAQFFALHQSWRPNTPAARSAADGRRCRAARRSSRTGLGLP